MSSKETGYTPSVSDESVRARTGRNWQEWFELLDARGAREMNHRQIVALLAGEYGVDPWWQQMITVTYEQARGLRDKHETPQGFQVSRSKTLPVPVERLFSAWEDEDQRSQWLPGAALSVRRATPAKSMRLDWEADGSLVSVYFYEKGEQRSQVAVNHEKLGSREQAEAMKGYWSLALNRLAAYLQEG